MALANVVDRGAPFHKMAEVALNPEPFTVRVKAAPPACAEDGLRLLMEKFLDPAEMVNIELLDTAPLLLTVTAADP